MKFSKFKKFSKIFKEEIPIKKILLENLVKVILKKNFLINKVNNF